MLKDQDEKYIDSNVSKVFHFLELRGHHNFLIGSNSIRNMLYANDYDLNSNIGVDDTIPVLRDLHKEFIHIFNVAYRNPNYYILDFKCGVYNDEPIRWSYEEIKRGTKHGVSFEECLLHDDNIIKLDLCYIHNNLFTDINCVYNLFIVSNKKELEKEKAIAMTKVKERLKEEITELEKEKEYYKAMKRYFSLSIVEGKMDEDILHIMNSDYGMFYKFISFLKLVVELLDQDFKPIKLSLIKLNLEYIKQFASHITTVKVDKYLDRLVRIIDLPNKQKVKSSLDRLIQDAGDDLNREISKVIQASY
ncbi:MAG: hypothetical protein EOO43_06270 [Flavobacterium sp.]|nr:MAG: hypothetical protein EOO43_06270 [Flavobacterium sp.]